MSAAAEFLTPEALCLRWKISVHTLRRMRSKKEIKTYHIGRSVRFAVADVVKFESEAVA